MSRAQVHFNRKWHWFKRHKMILKANIQNNNKRSNKCTQVLRLARNAFLIQTRCFYLVTFSLSLIRVALKVKGCTYLGANIMQYPFDDRCHCHLHNIHRPAGCACLECALQRKLSKLIN